MDRSSQHLFGNRRKAIAAGVVATLAMVVALPILATSSGAASDPSSNIDDYALYAVRTLQMKGQGSSVTGNIGAGTQHYTPGDINEYANGKEFLANNGLGAPAATGDEHVNICQGTNPATAITGYVVAPSADITYMKPTAANPNDLNPADPCQVPKLYTKAVTGPTPPANVWSASFTPPDINLPTVAAFEPGISTACDTSNTKNFTAGATLAPGAYGNVNIDKSSAVPTTTLSAGDYTFCSLSVQQSATLITTDQTRIYVVGNVNLKGGSNGGFGSPGTKVFVNGATLNFGRSGNVAGTFVAPNADVALGQQHEDQGPCVVARDAQ